MKRKEKKESSKEKNENDHVIPPSQLSLETPLKQKENAVNPSPDFIISKKSKKEKGEKSPSKKETPSSPQQKEKEDAEKESRMKKLERRLKRIETFASKVTWKEVKFVPKELDILLYDLARATKRCYGVFPASVMNRLAQAIPFSIHTLKQKMTKLLKQNSERAPDSSCEAEPNSTKGDEEHRNEEKGKEVLTSPTSFF
eukprot:TRINITY_DN115_c2_g2_i1.p1 TRINITY_DN115_c2_g2~~TRINITY_DN115_c2_g2_i1.p1  ORF type:complete len:199 (-),score=79.09 TRINITY_DN115_c2_g2_i1:59-655(-)